MNSTLLFRNGWLSPENCAGWCAAVGLALSLLYGHAADPFAENVRKTDPLTPDQEQKSFHLPPGFEIKLFAAEPDLAKPMNMAFDAKGRLWVTSTREYPFPVPLDRKGRDEIRILEDTDGDGRADKVTVFADGLNIPIGLYPYANGCVAWSIPNLWNFQDTDGDGKADKRDVLYGPFGWERDTHGMNSSFTRGFDGWVYATHGYNNNTTARGKDGHEITMNSGNTYRFRLDGSRVEQNTWGQVNPFGLCLDALGNLYSADCHSQPLYQLLRGGYYPSFGKPHDGLGFAPEMIFHEHGSTAISGIVYYSDDQWPAEYRDNVFTGNVVTSRIDRDAVTFNGSTPTANARPAFVSTDDPWFRPVNLQLGPDGALYIADFYNRIIGHYEVPLQHPGRDRERGRIWRIAYRGLGQGGTPSSPDQNSGLARRHALPTTIDGLIAELDGANLTRRMLAMNQLVDRFGRAAVEPVKRAIRSKKAGVFLKSHGPWVLHRLDELDEKSLAAAANDADRGVRIQAMRILSETAKWTSVHHGLALAGSRDVDPNVQRAAADALGLHPAFEHIRPLLALRHQVPVPDTHLLYVVRMALRNQLRPDENLRRLSSAALSEPDARAVADVAVAVPSPEAGAFLLKHVQKFREDRETLVRYLRHAARYVSERQIDELAAFAQKQFADDVDLQLALIKSVQEGLAQRGGTVGAATRNWGANLSERLLASANETPLAWHTLPVEGMVNPSNPWFLQQRASADGDKGSLFLCSLPPGGEELTGIMRSPTFELPAQLTFFMAGHDGFPDKAAQKKNSVRLRAADTGVILAESFPPRNDTAKAYSWDLSASAGKQGYLEMVDGDDGAAFAWLAVGRLKPPVVKLPPVSPSQISQRLQAVAELARSLSLTNLVPRLTALLGAEFPDLDTRAAVAKALASLNPNENLVALAPLIGDRAVPAGLRRKVSDALAKPGAPDALAVLEEGLRTAPYRAQFKLAQTLAGNATGAESLLKVIEKGQAAPRLLLERSIQDKLIAANPRDAAGRVAKMTKGLTPVSEELQKLIEQRRAAFAPSKADALEGERIFAKNCSVCHRINGQGGLVGPQLDGLGTRGLERIVEDVLDPNRNVDLAFRTHLVTLNDGEVISGLPRREEGEVLVLADSTGKEIAVRKKDIRARRESELSVMPENFGEIISPADFNHLMAYLLRTGNSQNKVP